MEERPVAGVPDGVVTLLGCTMLSVYRKKYTQYGFYTDLLCYYACAALHGLMYTSVDMNMTYCMQEKCGENGLKRFTKIIIN